MVKMTTPFGDSNAIKLVVDQVPESDEAALKIVVRQQLFLWFGLDERASYYAHHGDTAKSDEARTNLADLARSHPSSRYAQWAAYGVMWNEKNRILKSIEKHESTLASAAGALRAIQTEMERQAPNCPDHVRNFCMYSAAIIHLQLGEQEHAKSDFEKLSGSAASDFFSNRISNAQSTIFRKDDAP